jgi:aminoglycoside phosphotransferase (APT) family kinase protein
MEATLARDKYRARRTRILMAEFDLSRMNAQADTEQFREIAAALGALGLIGEGEQFAIAPLSGGVSCDVFRVEVERRRPVVVKRALARLRVEADWRAPVERAESEVEWIRVAGTLDGRIVPTVIAQDRVRHLFVMTYLPKAQFPVWKDELASGVVDDEFAGAVGGWLARIHASTAHAPDIARRFATKDQFHALRLDAYLLHAAAANPDVARELHGLVQGVAGADIALMQGDISPKNILHGPQTPVFLDAETACWGDPAFDLAFCLNHLLLKCIWRPEHTSRYAASFVALKDRYLAGVNWEARDATERRAASLLAGLLLARIDGKSPVEYITAERDKRFVREHAKTFLRQQKKTLDTMLADWAAAMQA